MTLQERLRTLRTQIGLSIEKMANELTDNGYSITFKTISGYENAFRQPSVQFLTGLTNVYDANPNWLLTGNGEIFLNKEKEYSIPQNLNFEDITFIPHVDLKVSAGYGSIIDEINMTKDFMAFAKEWIFKNVHVPTESLVLFTVNGDSMDAPASQIKDGGLILVDKSINEFKNDGIYVIALDDSLYVKRLQILPRRKLKVKSDNLNYDPFEVSLDTDNFHIVGKVIWAGALLECIK